jgi:hypothetical protein
VAAARVAGTENKGKRFVHGIQILAAARPTARAGLGKANVLGKGAIINARS